MKTAVILTILILICAVCFGEGIDNKLISCIIKVESSGDPQAIGKDSEIGLMQLSKSVIQEYNNRYSSEDLWYKEYELFDYCHNVTIGTWYLHRLKDHYLKDRYTLKRLLAAWNGGPTRLRKVGYDVDKMPKSTQQYISKVMKCYTDK